MFDNLILGNEKAVVGGLSAGLLTLLSQLGVNGQMTVKEAVYAGVSWVVTHILIYVVTNTEKPVVPPAPPVNTINKDNGGTV